jgi:hypothetical protein
LPTVTVLAVALSQVGCSRVFLTPAHHYNGVVNRQCSTGQGLPTADVLFATLQGARTVYALAADDSAYANAALSREADVGLGLVFLASFISSAVYGFTEVNDCRELTGWEPPPPSRSVRPMKPGSAMPPPPRPRTRPAPARPAPAVTPDGGGGADSDAGAAPDVPPAPPVPQQLDDE